MMISFLLQLCDPKYKGTDHTRECVPVIMFGKRVIAENVGCRESYADIAETIAKFFGIEGFGIGKGFL